MTDCFWNRFIRMREDCGPDDDDWVPMHRFEGGQENWLLHTYDPGLYNSGTDWYETNSWSGEPIFTGKQAWNSIKEYTVQKIKIELYYPDDHSQFTNLYCDVRYRQVTGFMSTERFALPDGSTNIWIIEKPPGHLFVFEYEFYEPMHNSNSEYMHFSEIRVRSGRYDRVNVRMFGKGGTIASV